MPYNLFADPSETASKLYPKPETPRHRSPFIFTKLLGIITLLTILSFGASFNHTRASSQAASPQLTIVTDDVVTMAEDSSVSIAILANDAPAADLDMDSFKISLAPSYGSFAILPTLEIRYQPFENFWGEDLFEYQICSIDGASCEKALVSIQVVPANDQITAVDDQAVAIAGVPVTIDVLANDIDYDLDINVSTLSVVTPTAHGTIQVIDQQIVYTTSAASSFDQFSYQICDQPSVALADISCSVATVHISLRETETVTKQVEADGTINIAPNGVERNSSPTIQLINSPNHGTVTIEFDGTLSYQPASDFTGTDEFMIQTCRAADDCRTIQYSVTVGAMKLHIPLITL